MKIRKDFQDLSQNCLLNVLTMKLRKRAIQLSEESVSPRIESDEENGSVFEEDNYVSPDIEHQQSLKDLFDEIIGSDSQDLSELIRTLDVTNLSTDTEDSMRKLQKAIRKSEDLENMAEDFFIETESLKPALLENLQEAVPITPATPVVRSPLIEGTSEPMPSLSQIEIPVLDLESVSKRASVKLRHSKVVDKKITVGSRLSYKNRIKPLDIKKKRVYTSDEEDEKDKIVSMKKFLGVSGLISTMTTSYRRKRNSIAFIGKIKRSNSLEFEKETPEVEDRPLSITRQPSLPIGLTHPDTSRLLPPPPSLRLPRMTSLSSMLGVSSEDASDPPSIPRSPSLPNLSIAADANTDDEYEGKEKVCEFERSQSDELENPPKQPKKSQQSKKSQEETKESQDYKKLVGEINEIVEPLLTHRSQAREDEKLKSGIAELLKDTPRIRGIRPKMIKSPRTQWYTEEEITQESEAVLRLRKLVLRMEVETSTEKKGVDYKEYKHYIQPLDLVFFRGGDFISDLVRFIQERSVKPKSSAQDIRIPSSSFSHVGMIVTKEILNDDRLEEGKLYVWESTMSGNVGDGVKNIDGETFFGVQLRDFEEVAKLYNGENGTHIAIAHLKEDIKKSIWEDFPQRILSERFTTIFKKYDGVRYDMNLISLGASFIPALRPLRDLVETKEWLFCSELVACVYKDLGLLPSDINPKNTVPMDFLGFDNEIKNEVIPVVIEKPVDILILEEN